MAEFELLELADMQTARIMWASMNIVTLLFGYLTVAFLVGKKFSPLIAVTLTVVYSFAYVGPLLTVFASVRGSLITYQQYALLFPDGAFVAPPWSQNLPWVTLAIGPLLLGYLVSVLYMHAYVRRASVALSE